MPRILLRLVLAALLLVLPARAAIPDRPGDAVSGSEFARQVSSVHRTRVQAEAMRQLKAGNLPDFLRRFVPVKLERKLADGALHRAIVRVAPDYLALGDDSDFLRLPLDRPSATSIARAFGCVLPTTRIVDAVHEQATHVLRPSPLPPGPRMRSLGYFLQHSALVRAQLARADGGLTAGHKKDLVLTRRLDGHADRVAIYGWHYPDGRPIQPLSIIHGADYADYSHGVRLVGELLLVDGRPRSIYDVLNDQLLAPLLSAEGTLPGARQVMGVGPDYPRDTLPAQATGVHWDGS